MKAAQVRAADKIRALTFLKNGIPQTFQMPIWCSFVFA